MSLSKYKTYDLIILCVLMVLIDFLIFKLNPGTEITENGTNVYKFGLYLSLAFPILSIAYIRWGFISIINNMILVIIHYFLWKTVFVNEKYLASYILALISWGLFYVVYILLEKTRKFDMKFNIVLSYILTYILFMSIEFLISNLIFNLKITFLSIIVRNLLNFILTFVIIVIAVIQSNFVVDMKKYILNLKKEEKQRKEKNYDE